MNPELLNTYSSILSNIVTCLTAIILAIVAIYGLRTWRRQMIGQKRYETAHKLLLLARRFRAAFRRARGAATWSSEYAGRSRSENETPEETRILDEKYARLNRLQPALDILVELEQVIWETEILTNEDLVPIVHPFGEVAHELNIAILQHFDTRFEAASRPSDPGRVALAHTYDQTELIYQPGEDDLTKRVDDALAELEKRLKRLIRQ